MLEAGTYLVEFRYAADEARPGNLHLNDSLVSTTSMGQETGGWKPRNQNWIVQGVFEFKKGVNHMSFQSAGPWAHLDQIQLTRRKAQKQLSADEYKKNCGKRSQCESNVGRTCSLTSGLLGPGVSDEKYTQPKRLAPDQYCGIDTHYNIPRKCGSGSQIDTAVANTKDTYNLCEFVRVNRDFCFTQRLQDYRFSSLSPQKGKTGADICTSLKKQLKDANIFLLHR